MKVNVKITDLQIARDIIKKELASLVTRKNATIGIHADAGIHADSKMTMAQLGATLNYGNEKIPARPWLIPGVESGRKEQVETFAEVFAKTQSADKALEAAASVAAGNVQQFMTDLKDPPNAPSTIKKKGSSNPLIDTGALRQSVTYKINSVKPEEGL